VIAPNKVVTLRESALSLAPVIMAEGPHDISLTDLYDRVVQTAEGLEQFMLAIDVLFVLGKLSVDLDTGVVSYAS